jgi:uncharacterized protein YcfL
MESTPRDVLTMPLRRERGPMAIDDLRTLGGGASALGLASTAGLARCTLQTVVTLSAQTATEGAKGMPLFMDVHESLPDGATAKDVAQAHAADIKTQEQYGVNYRKYWVDEQGGKVFCLVEAPDAETAVRVHREARGLVPDRIYPVEEGS